MKHGHGVIGVVLIRYGKFSNGTLLLDFGFALSSNIYDQVPIEVDIPHHDPLHAMKMDLLRRHFTPAIEDVNGFSSCGNSFIIKEVKSTSRNGRGIPQSLRAFARVLCSTSPQELSDLAKEAAQTDGRLARHPLKNMTTELQAHEFLLSRISRSIEGYSAAIKFGWLDVGSDLVSGLIPVGVCFDLSDVTVRDPSDSPLAPQWYRLEGSDDPNSGRFSGDVQLSVWIGTQADERELGVDLLHRFWRRELIFSYGW